MGKLKIDRGTTYSIGVTYQKNGVATSLVGATVRFTMKSAEYDTNTSDTTAAILKNVTNGTVAGQATIVILPADTATLTPGKYYYDIKIAEATGEVYKIDEGTVVLDGSPTNRLA